MFSSNSKGNGIVAELSRAASRSNAVMPTLIGDGLTINGNLKGDNEIQIDGVVEGNVKCRVLTIGESGKVNGKVNADKVVISGSFTGQIKAVSVSLTNSAKVQGDITVRDGLSIENGAQFEGQCKRVHPAEKPKEKTLPGKFGHKKPGPVAAVIASKSNSGFTPPKAVAN